jgi:hypothetical protein
MSLSTSPKIFPEAGRDYDILALRGALTRGKILFVDGTNGSDTNDGLDGWSNAKATIQAAVTAGTAFDTVLIAAKAMAAGATDPGSYSESIIIPATHEGMALVGVSRGRTQGGLPQIKPAGAANGACLTIRSCGCHIQNLGFNGNSTAGAPINNGILLDDDNSTKTAIGTTIENCHFKNCAGSTVTSGATGGAIVWSAAGGAWQTHIKGNRFYKNVADVCLLGTSQTVPQDVIIEDNIFSGPAASVDCNLYLAGGSGMNGVIIRNNVFGQLPAIGSGAVKRYIYATGCVGMAVQNFFGCQTSGTGGTPITFKVSGTGAEIPVTLHMAGNFGQSITIDATGGEVSIA